MPKITADIASFKHPKFAPLTLDFTFKKAFANEQSTELLLFLLNTFLERVLKKPIIEVKIIHTVQLGRTRKKRGAVFDIQCEDASGARFIVEMQVEEQKHFIKRSLFYLCMALANLAKKGRMENRGKKIPYDYNIPIVYTLSFLNFDVNFGENCDEVMQYISLSNEIHPEARYDLVHLVFVRLSKFDKTEEECKSDIDRLLFIFKNAHNLDKVPKIFNKPVFKQLFEIARISNFTEEELMNYESDMKRFSDHMNALAYAKEKGVTQGITQGVLQTAKNMLAKGFSVADVLKATNLPREQVRALKRA
ncbi:MAG: Rpn family recombination-promoting nuclease/putative transposase [Fibromonadaceae bacterium]|jgi:predicted transposase/invertase (TIGR01784 family)|nr:Rpn family recombination-promoting nuclease/putative transposase [Fibromonadaceae bacterium]